MRRRVVSRLAAATLTTGLAAAGALSGAGTAHADAQAQSQSGATATLGGLKTYGEAVIHRAGGDLKVAAGLFEMSVEEGGMLQTYCIDMYNPAQKDAKYQEAPWNGTSLGTNKSAGKIRWILQNSFPQVNDLAVLAERAGVGSLTEQDAAVGTQVAIWRYSDGANADAVGSRAEKLADYLEKSARAVAEPRASLTLDPPAVSGHTGERLGPVTVHTNARGVTVIPPTDAAISGVRIVDEKGKAVTSVKNGSRLYFDVPANTSEGIGGQASPAPAGVGGTATLTVQASTTVPVGRAFVSENRSQTQILAGSSETTVSATASADWAAKGPIPALSAGENCAEGVLDINARDAGDKPFTFKLMGGEHTIPAGTSRTVTVPLQENQAYDFTITGPNGFSQRFTGILDCRTQSGEGGMTVQTVDEPSPATQGDTSRGTTNLAATGGSGATSVITGAAIALVVIGGAVLVLLRRKEATPDTD